MNFTIKITYLIGVLLPSLMLINFASASEKLSTEQEAWFKNQIMQHPSMIAAKQQLHMQLSLANASTKPLYNPELISSYERDGSQSNYSVGFNQTVDVWGKNNVLTEQSKFKRLQAQQNYILTYQNIAADTFIALIKYQSAKQILSLVKEQENQMINLIDEIKKKQKVNELSELDLQVALFTVATQLNETSIASLNLLNSKAKIKTILTDWDESKEFNAQDLLIGKNLNIEALDQQKILMLPIVQQAYAKMVIDKYQVQLTKLSSNSEPTIGLSAGQAGKESTLGLNLSLPLNFRNDFSDEIKASTSNHLASKANYASTILEQKNQIEASKVSMEQYIQQVKHWQRLAGKSGQRSIDLIEQKWNAGDINTTNYLLVLQQRINGLTAALSLQEQAKLATINYLRLTAQLSL